MLAGVNKWKSWIYGRYLIKFATSKASAYSLKTNAQWYLYALKADVGFYFCKSDFLSVTLDKSLSKLIFCRSLVTCHVKLQKKVSWRFLQFVIHLEMTNIITKMLSRGRDQSNRIKYEGRLSRPTFSTLFYIFPSFFKAFSVGRPAFMIGFQSSSLVCQLKAYYHAEKKILFPLSSLQLFSSSDISWILGRWLGLLEPWLKRIFRVIHFAHNEEIWNAFPNHNLPFII